MRVRLNGWQRLWVLLAALWTVVVGGVTWFDWPPPEPAAHEVVIVGGDGKEHVFPPGIDKKRAAAIARDHLANRKQDVLTDEDLLTVRDEDPLAVKLTPVERQRRSALFQEIELRTLEEFYAPRFAAVRVAAALWLLPPAAVYALGWSVGWVRRGFRPAGGIPLI